MPVNRGQFYTSIDRYPDICINVIVQGVKADIRDRQLFREQVEQQLGGKISDLYFESIWRSVVNE